MAEPLNSRGLEALAGCWRHPAPWNSEDYVAEYIIAVEKGVPSVTAHDLIDGEAFVITDVRWDGRVLTFRSLMPSTGRSGINEFSLTAEGTLKSRFTFTVVEEFHRRSAS